MFNKLSPRALMILAGGISVLIAILLYSYLTDLESSTEVKMMEVVVAAEDIPPNTVITSKHVKTIDLPSDLVQTDTYNNIDEVLGITVKDAIYQGEQLNRRRFNGELVQSGFTGLIPNDKRAMTVAISDTTGIAGFAKPGNFVDIMLVTSKSQKNMITGKIFLQNMLLLAVNKVEKNDGEIKPLDNLATATLAVTPQEAVQLAVAQQQGTLYMMLRPSEPKNNIVLSNEVDVVDMSRIQTTAPQQPVNNQAAYQPVNQQPVSYAPVQNSQQAAGNSSEGGRTIQVIRGNSVETIKR